MSKKSNKLASIIIGPVLVFGGILSLWENEGRFNYYEAARDAITVTSPDQRMGETISYTGSLDTSIPIQGEYIQEFVSYHLIERHAQIYSWDESEDSDGNTEWSKGWYSRIDDNSRNRGLQKKLSSTTLYPPRYSLGGMNITADRIHFVDDDQSVSISNLSRTEKARSPFLATRSNYLYLSKGRTDNIGDERIRYTGIPNAKVASYFGRVLNDEAVGKQFEKNTGVISGLINNDGILHHLVNGEREASLVKIQSHFTRMLWYTRIGGTVAIVFGFFFFFGSFVSLLYRVPLLGNFIEAGVFIASLVLGLAIALFVILSSILFYNPVTLGLPVVVLVAGILYLIRRSSVIKKNAGKLLSEKIAAQSSMQGNNLLEKTFSHLAIIAYSEGKLVKKEKKMLKQWGEQNGLNKNRMEEIFTEAVTGNKNDYSISKQDFELLLLMALSDGAVSKQELKVLERYASKAGISSYELRNMIAGIEDDNLELVF